MDNTNDNVVSLNAKRADKAKDNTLLTPEELLVDCLKEVREGKMVGQHMVIVMLDDANRRYDTHIRMANLTWSATIGLLTSAMMTLHDRMVGRH